MSRRELHPLMAIVIVVVLAVAACSGDEVEETGGAATITSTPIPGTPEALPTTTDLTVASDPRGASGAAGASTSTEAPSTTSTTEVTNTTIAPTSTTSTRSTTTTPTTTSTTVAGPRAAYVRIGSDSYPFTLDECVVYDGIDAVVTGDGMTPDGAPIYVTLMFDELRVDIGTDYWLAGNGADDLEVTLDVFEVTATSTLVSGTGLPDTDGEIRADCG